MSLYRINIVPSASFKNRIGRMFSFRAIICLTVMTLLMTGCGGSAKTAPPGKVVDTELAQELSAARATFARGAWPQAASLYRLALKRTELMDDPVEIANAAFNYAATLVQTADYDGARLALAEAKAEAVRAAAPTSDIVSLEAHVAQLQGKLDDAVRLSDTVLADKAASAEDRLQSTLVKGQVACARKDSTTARAIAAQARTLIAGGTSPSFAAGIAELDGCIALLDHNPALAAERFDRQATFLRDGRLYGDMVRALGHAGQAYADANQPAPAADRCFRAARSAIAQNDLAGARPLLDAAASYAAKAVDNGLIERISRLQKSLPVEKS